MGIGIHRAIGWGMEWNRFEELATLGCAAHETSETLWGIFRKDKVPSLVIPKEVCRETFNTVNIPPILEANLLATNFSEYGRKDVENGSADDLYCIIDIADGKEEHICFFPNLYYRKSWYRGDDTLDYQFEAWRSKDGRDEFDKTSQPMSRERDVMPRDFVKYLPYGHYPFTNFLMLEDGTPEPWDHFTRLQKRPDILPAVPSEIRWYLRHLGIMDNAGISKLRPILAQWWC